MGNMSQNAAGIGRFPAASETISYHSIHVDMVAIHSRTINYHHFIGNLSWPSSHMLHWLMHVTSHVAVAAAAFFSVLERVND